MLCGQDVFKGMYQSNGPLFESYLSWDGGREGWIEVGDIEKMKAQFIFL